MTTTFRLSSLALAVAAGAAVVSAQAPPKFFSDDPLWNEPISQNVTQARDYEPNLIYQSLQGLLSKPGDKNPNVRAKNINTVDQVPDGMFYVNRAGRMPLTPAIVARGSNTSDGPVPGPWTVVSGKSDGVTPGFTIRDKANDLWFVKFDPPGYRGMATGTEVAAAKLMWAVGYHTVEYYLRQMKPSDLVVGETAKITPMGQKTRRMVQADVAMLLSKADRDPDGTYRVIVSKAAPGKPVGRIRFDSTRKDDPNDIVPHEHRRELRGYRVFAAWLNHVDAKGINSIDVLVKDGDKQYIRRYLLDFGSVLGSGGIGPTEKWEGYERLMESPSTILTRTVALGFAVPEWKRMTWYESPTVGRLPTTHANWDPDAWDSHINNGAFWHMRADDAFWAAEKLSYITDDIVAASVAEGQFGDEKAAAELARVIRERRDRILQTYLPALNPVTDVALDASGQLTFRNLAVDARVAKAPAGYKADWFRFDNTTGTRTPIGTTEGATSPLAAPSLPSDGYISVDVRAVGGPAAWSQPVVLHFRRAAGAWQLVGLVRQP